MSDEILVLLTRLDAGPLRLARAVRAIPLDVWTAADDGEWSPAQVLAHVRAADDIIAYRAYAILVRDNSPLTAFDDMRWVEVTGYAEADRELSLQALAIRRAELTTMLRRAAPADWQRTGSHEQRGPLVLLDLVKDLIEHEEEHIAQLEMLRPA